MPLYLRSHSIYISRYCAVGNSIFNELFIPFVSGLAVPFVELTVAHASVLTILAISFERYYAICEPLRAGYVCTKTRATLICGLAWFFAALFTRLVGNKQGMTRFE